MRAASVAAEAIFEEIAAVCHDSERKRNMPVAGLSEQPFGCVDL
jgi:hypothetical protein